MTAAEQAIENLKAERKAKQEEPRLVAVEVSQPAPAKPVAVPDEAAAEIARLKAKIAEMEKKGAKRFTFKTNPDSGCISLLGLRRFPVSFYEDEWRKILDAKDEILAYLDGK